MGRRPVRWVWLQQSSNQLPKLEGDVQTFQGRLRWHRAWQRLPTNALVQRGPCHSHTVVATHVASADWCMRTKPLQRCISQHKKCTAGTSAPRENMSAAGDASVLAARSSGAT